MTTQPQEQPNTANRFIQPEWDTALPNASDGQQEPTNEQLALPLGSTDVAKPNRKRSAVLQGAAVAALGGALLYGVGSELINNQTAPLPNTAPEHAQEAPKTTIDKINDTGRDLANGVITILAKPGSGAEAYGGESVGNKSAVVGPDGKSGTKDDLTKAPESTISYDAAKNAIYVISTQEYSEQKGSSFSSVWLSIKLEADNPITLVKGQPKLEDFKQALAEGNPIDVTDLEAELHVYGKQPGQSVKFTEENGVPHIVVDEFSNGSKDGVTETSQSDDTFDTTANRVIQVAEATIQDLTK